MLSFFLTATDTTVLKRGEYGGGNVGVVHLLAAPAVEAARQQAAGVDCHRRQLRLALQHVPDGEDIGHIGLLLRCVDLASLGVDGHSNRVKAEIRGEGSTAGSDQHRVEELLVPGKKEKGLN